MKLKLKRRARNRALVAAALVLLVSIGVKLVLDSLRENISFYYTPKEQHKIRENQVVRIGGIVEKGSLIQNGTSYSFNIIDNSFDGTSAIKVEYEGRVTPIFREGQGVVLKGSLIERVFKATEMLTKHDETYAPERYNLKTSH